MSAFSEALGSKEIASDASLTGTTHPSAALVCLFGVLLRIVISDPLLDYMGVDYMGDTGGIFGRIHMANFFIFLSFLMLLASDGRPLREAVRIYKKHKVFSVLLILDLLLLLYWAFRGPKGIGFLVDTHLPVPIAAIVLSYAPRSYCRTAVRCFIAFAILNGILGIAESIGRFRFYSFDPDWVVAKEAEFRASALIGHPLKNAAFTALAVFAVLALKGNPFLKIATLALFIVSLVAFGGRTSLSVSVIGICIYGLSLLRHSLRNLSLFKFFLFIALILAAPVLLAGSLYAALTSDMGERLMAFSSFDDSSAEARSVAFSVFNYMSRSEILFGVGSDKLNELVYSMGLKWPMLDIENSWILMLIQLGVIPFAAWLLAMFALIWRLIKNNSLALKIAVLGYFIIASSSNAFGRKDFMLTVLVTVIICLSRGYETQASVFSAPQKV